MGWGDRCFWTKNENWLIWEKHANRRGCAAAVVDAFFQAIFVAAIFLQITDAASLCGNICCTLTYTSCRVEKGWKFSKTKKQKIMGKRKISFLSTSRANVPYPSSNRYSGFIIAKNILISFLALTQSSLPKRSEKKVNLRGKWVIEISVFLTFKLVSNKCNCSAKGISRALQLHTRSLQSQIPQDKVSFLDCTVDY